MAEKNGKVQEFMVKPSPVTAAYHDRQANERGVRHNDKVWSKWPQKVVIVGWAAKQRRHYGPPPDACQFRMFYCHCLALVPRDEVRQCMLA